MSWGPLYFYYCCPRCSKKFKYAEDLISYYGKDFGLCPDCLSKGALIMGEYIKDGPIASDDSDYTEVEE